jgi:hypothetical protein
MTEHVSGRGGPIDVHVHIESVEEENGTGLIWYYNGITGKSLNLLANIYTSEIHFKLDLYTQNFFKFKDAYLQRACSDDGLEYTDLDKVSVSDHCVIISDSQANHHRVTVGGVKFEVTPLKKAPYGAGYNADPLISPDPEVTNTGENGGPPPAKKASAAL